MVRSLPFRRSRQAGRGLLSRLHHKVKSLLSAPLQGSSRLQKTLKQIGLQIIGRLYVARTPVVSGVQKALQLLSLGKYEQVKSELHYDDVYHLFFVIQLTNGRLWKLEKNHIVELTHLSSFPTGAQDITYIGMKHTQQLLQQAQLKYGSHLWAYNPQGNNCQNFVQQLCLSNSLHASTDLGKEYLQVQDSDALIRSLPGFLQAIPKVLTDVASTGDRILHGDGMRRPRGVHSRYSL